MTNITAEIATELLNDKDWCHCHSLSLAPVIPDWFYLSGASSFCSPWQRAVKHGCVCFTCSSDRLEKYLGLCIHLKWLLMCVSLGLTDVRMADVSNWMKCVCVCCWYCSFVEPCCSLPHSLASCYLITTSSSSNMNTPIISSLLNHTCLSSFLMLYAVSTTLTAVTPLGWCLVCYNPASVVFGGSAHVSW